MIKITGGYLRSRILRSVSGDQLRPTTSFFREWIFNVINYFSDISNVTLLDLFSGTGVISFEFISRNAKEAVMVDKNNKFLKISTENIKKLGIDNILTVKSEALSYLKKLISFGEVRFNVIFLDPPYEDKNVTNDIIELISDNINDFPADLIVITETSKQCDVKIPDCFELYRSKKGGSTKMSILRRKDHWT